MRLVQSPGRLILYRGDRSKRPLVGINRQLTNITLGGYGPALRLLYFS